MSELKAADTARAKEILEILPTVMRGIRREMRKLAQAELTVPQFRVLVRLSEGPAANREIAEWLGVTAPTATRMIDALVRRELVSRSSDEAGDARKVSVKLTVSGRSRLAGLQAIVQSQIVDRLAPLPKRKKMALSSGLAVLAELFPRQHRRLSK